MQKYINFTCLLAVIFCLSVSALAAAPATANATPAVIAFQLDRLGDFLSKPGELPVEALRRLGRAINKNWPASSKQLVAASIFDSSKFATPDFLKPLLTEQLTSKQQELAKNLLSTYQTELEKIIAECHPASQAIIIKTVCDSKTMKQHFLELLASPAKKIEPQQQSKIESQLLPILEASDTIIGAFVISENGFFGRFNIISPDGKLADQKVSHNISIADYINNEPLMFFCQTHPLEGTASLMAQIMEIPQSATIVNMVASAGLDFEKDILANSARESILYVNLQPDGDGGLPDIRFVAPVPMIDKLVKNLPKFKNLCVQSGIFTNTITADNNALVKLSYFMIPNIAIYAGLLDNFLVIATSQKNILQEFTHLKKVKNGEKTERQTPDNLKRFWRIRAIDFNQQLQNLLQSPLLSDKGIPPVSNLKFMENLGDLELFSTSTPSLIEFIVNLPIISADKDLSHGINPVN